MIFSDMRSTLQRPTTSALLLLEFAATHGVPAQEVLKSSRWTLPSLKQPGASISASEELALIANTVRALPAGRSLGLDLGLRYHLTAYGIWGFALMTSPTLRSAFALGLRYIDLTYSDLQMQLITQGDEICLDIDASALPKPLRRFLIERDLAAIATMQREMFIEAQLPLRIELAHAAPAAMSPYLEALGLEPRFGMPHNRIVFATAHLDRPLPQANPLAAQLAEAQCRQLLTQRRARSGMDETVRNTLLGHIGGTLPDIEEIASQLALSSRTLRRRLRMEGTSYRALLDELRQTLADELLGNTNMKVAEVATRLGYAEAASFQHARKRWRQRLAAELAI